MTKVCDQCGKEQDTSRFNPECGSPLTCFRCRVSSVSLGFGGHQESFHNDTIRAFQERTVREGRANGLDPQLKTNHGAGPTSSQLSKLKSHLGGVK